MDAARVDQEALCWRVEAACLNAWPAPRHVFLDGWLLRASGGPTRRANSANPLHAGAAADMGLIEAVEAFYGRLGQPALFRIPDMARGIDALLAARGYALEGRTHTLFAPMEALVLPDMPEIAVTDRPDARWLAARDAMSGSDARASAAYRAIIGALLLPCGFASVEADGRIAAVAFGARQGDLLVIESVLTDPAVRRRGHAGQVLGGLLRWARGQGVSAVALQVMADNAPALALYEGLGFRRTLYGYHYRVHAPVAG